MVVQIEAEGAQLFRGLLRAFSRHMLLVERYIRATSKSHRT